MNPAAGVSPPAPGRPKAPQFRRLGAADRIRIFLTGHLVAHRPTIDVVAPLAVLSLVSVVGTLAAPALRGNPMLLITLSPRLPFLVLAASGVGFVPFVLIGTLRLCLADPFHFLLGRRVAATTVGSCRLYLVALHGATTLLR